LAAAAAAVWKSEVKIEKKSECMVASPVTRWHALPWLSDWVEIN